MPGEKLLSKRQTSQLKHSKQSKKSPREGADQVGWRKLLGLKSEVEEIRDKNKQVMDNLEIDQERIAAEHNERVEIDKRLEALANELNVLAVRRRQEA